MKKRDAKTVRFASIVERSGAPEVHTLWIAPEKDPVLKRAEKEHRVMTITQPGHGRADIGEVGFQPGTDAVRQYLIFPRSLARFKGSRIVGVNFDRVAQPKLAVAKASKRAPKPPRPQATRKPMPVQKPAPSAPPKSEPPPKPVAIKPVPVKQEPAKQEPETPLRREIRAAMEALEKGHSAAARRKLERLLAQT